MSSSLKNLSDFSHLAVGNAENLKFAIVVSQWNAQITGALLNGAYQGLLNHGAKEENIELIEVPGSYELISGSDIALRNKELDAVITLGCVIQGETRHFDFICDAVANGIAQVGIKYNKPVIFGVLTTDNEQQALDRAGGKHGNKGEEAAITAIQMGLIHKNH
ncbi:MULTISPECIES: 6,7-dimethyl-8-ribityllumazine synthase [Sphingobacterium]|uniref:6,7-dimethyl-8-ribityllumazine synthase n=1 Tax=Sphingobacterium cellulitidis TaxID=1768011 RepID=A0A8H9G2K1_9SPHI|nr:MULTISPECIES: 6,7-dimethyl-8-ribityllumazine synthase [Sphingobacterium]MBA8987377.1 6,7-dimethyl-8-ribityllumazine synthase [Sphingobacterium soli]OYD40536.1 6,7-dimethyl-8-ribityllumazine synthase [Sphingobacterium cellulitidis]WFB63103.1 6,7-dimethyl-8-ribityllumazine synthase [Sphingobacterium sp. WM]GGE25294.1 6,7-dimethyl-8-ribityllumazine synthase [Sphingobacterium soli]